VTELGGDAWRPVEAGGGLGWRGTAASAARQRGSGGRRRGRGARG
jgi:hypothetical protein